MLPHDAPVAFFDPGVVILFVGPGARHLTGSVALREEVLHVMVNKLRPVVCIEAAYAKRQLTEQVFESVAGDVPALVPYGSVLRPVGEFIRESQSPDKVTGKIALTVGYRVNAQ